MESVSKRYGGIGKWLLVPLLVTAAVMGPTLFRSSDAEVSLQEDITPVTRPSGLTMLRQPLPPAPTTSAPIPPPTTTTTVTAPPATTSSTVQVSPSTEPVVVTPPKGSNDWDAVQRCECPSGWHCNTGNGYYGGLQFDLPTWRSVGGPGYPHEHSREVQIHYAEILFSQRGASPWPHCGKYL